MLYVFRWICVVVTRRRSITSCNIKRILEVVFLSLIIFSIWLKYWSIRGLRQTTAWWVSTHFSFINAHQTIVSVIYTLAFSKSRSLPMVDNSLHRHSKDSSSWFLSNFTMQSCIMTSVSIFSLNSSPINLILPSERLLALSLASCSSSTSRCFSSPCQGKHVKKMDEEQWVRGMQVNSHWICA